MPLQHGPAPLLGGLSPPRTGIKPIEIGSACNGDDVVAHIIETMMRNINRSEYVSFISLLEKTFDFLLPQYNQNAEGYRLEHIHFFFPSNHS